MPFMFTLRVALSPAFQTRKQAQSPPAPKPSAESETQASAAPDEAVREFEERRKAEGAPTKGPTEER